MQSGNYTAISWFIHILSSILFLPPPPVLTLPAPSLLFLHSKDDLDFYSFEKMETIGGEIS